MHRNSIASCHTYGIGSLPENNVPLFRHYLEILILKARDEAAVHHHLAHIHGLFPGEGEDIALGEELEPAHAEGGGHVVGVDEGQVDGDVYDGAGRHEEDGGPEVVGEDVAVARGVRPGGEKGGGGGNATRRETVPERLLF